MSDFKNHLSLKNSNVKECFIMFHHWLWEVLTGTLPIKKQSCTLHTNLWWNPQSVRLSGAPLCSQVNSGPREPGGTVTSTAISTITATTVPANPEAPTQTESNEASWFETIYYHLLLCSKPSLLWRTHFWLHFFF